MARKDVSPKGLGSGIRMIQYFINRGGRNLSARRRTELERAKRILQRRGVLGKFSRSIGIARVQDVSTSQSVFGRLFDYGNVEIESAGRMM